jgi:hypothetical protein
MREQAPRYSHVHDRETPIGVADRSRVSAGKSNIDWVVDGRIVEHGRTANLLGPLLETDPDLEGKPPEWEDGTPDLAESG